MSNTFGSELKGILKERGLSQRQLAKGINSKDKMIYKYVRGDSIPKVETVRRIEKFLDLPAGYLEDKIETRTPPDSAVHYLSPREEKILLAWERGKRTLEEVEKITGYEMKIIRQYLPIGEEG